MSLSPNILFDNRYRLRELKGRGTYGEVWLAHDNQTDMDMALKVYIALDDRGISEFRSEYRNAFGLNHPNLLHPYQFDLCDSRPYLVMPYCPHSATELIGRADEAALWRLIRDVASGLEYLHSKGIVHCDIKPDNILVDKDGNYLIADFGISAKIRSTLQRNSLRHTRQDVRGSIPYMAPEMFSEQANAVYASDIWALGSTLYEMTTGELPLFGQGGALLLYGKKVDCPKTTFSKNLMDTIMDCLAKDPWDRPQVTQLVERAQKALEGEIRKTKFKEKSLLATERQDNNGASKLDKFKKSSIWIALAATISLTLFIIDAYVEIPFLFGIALSIGLCVWLLLSYCLVALLVDDVISFNRAPQWMILTYAITIVSYSVISSFSSQENPFVGKLYIFIAVNGLSAFACWMISLMAKGTFKYKKAILWMALTTIASLPIIGVLPDNSPSVRFWEVMETILLFVFISVLVINWVILHCIVGYFIVKSLVLLEKRSKGQVPASNESIFKLIFNSKKS